LDCRGRIAVDPSSTQTQTPMSGFATGFAGGAAAGTAVAPGVGTAIGAAVGAFSSLIGGDQKEQQREAYLNQQAALAQGGNADALKDIYDWANGISATEYDGTNRGDEPTQSRQYAQQILLNLQKNGISWNPTTQSMQYPGIAGSVAGVTQIATVVGGSPFVGFLEIALVIAAAIAIADYLGGGK
jgi:hypothetical protein